MIKVKKYNTACLDVDPQNGFTSLCPNELPVRGATQIVDGMNLNATFARLRILSKDAHSQYAVWIANEQNKQLAPVQGNYPNLDVHWNAHCLVGTRGLSSIVGLPDPNDYDMLIYKGVERDMHPYSAIYHDHAKKITTGIIEYLKCNDISTVILGGLTLDYCLGDTAIDLRNAGFEIIINLSATKIISRPKTTIFKKTADKIGIILITNTDELKSI